MARVSGVDLPNNKRVDIALRYLFGVGPTNARKILDNARVDHAVRVKDLSEDEIVRIQKMIEGYTVEGDLRRLVTLIKKF